MAGGGQRERESRIERGEINEGLKLRDGGDQKQTPVAAWCSAAMLWESGGEMLPSYRLTAQCCSEY